jgi:twitching motility protein PilT
MERIAPSSALGELLLWTQTQAATDLHLQTARRMTIRVHGELIFLDEEKFPPLSRTAFAALVEEAFSASVGLKILSQQETDLSFYCGENRYRANFSRQQGELSGVFRIVPQQKMKLQDLQLPPSLSELLREVRGIILVTGPTGEGKSTTVRALLEELNQTESLRIITIEDPIEFVFQSHFCQFEQREVGIDTSSFARGIRNAMRQDPDVIFVGEIRDQESIFAAMQAAETGHLVITTLHADSVPQAIGRIREHYPSSEQNNISSLLSRNVKAIICQRLLPNTMGTRTPCLEIVRTDRGVQQAIQSNDLHLLTGIIEASVHQGMHSFDQYLQELLAEEIITYETAEAYAVNRHRLEMVIRGFASNQGILKPDPVK